MLMEQEWNFRKIIIVLHQPSNNSCNNDIEQRTFNDTDTVAIESKRKRTIEIILTSFKYLPEPKMTRCTHCFLKLIDFILQHAFSVIYIDSHNFSWLLLHRRRCCRWLRYRCYLYLCEPSVCEVSMWTCDYRRDIRTRWMVWLTNIEIYIHIWLECSN